MFFLPLGALCPDSIFLQSTSSRDIRQRNEQFSSKARAGKNPVNASRKERLEKQSPIPLWALGLILVVVIGGGTSTCSFLGLHRS